MPKGHVPERECVCRACDRPFLTTKVGRAKWFCRKPDCPSASKPKHTVSGRRRPTASRRAQLEARERRRLGRELLRLLKRREREMLRAQARERKRLEAEEARRQRTAKREQDRLERERAQAATRERRIAEAQRVREEREAHQATEKAVARARRERERRDKRERREREQRAAKLRAAIDRLQPRAQKAIDQARELVADLNAKRAELAELEGTTAPAPVTVARVPAEMAAPHHTVPAPRHDEIELHGGGALAAILDEIRTAVIHEDRVGSPDRNSVKRAVVHLAAARGIPATRVALRAISVATIGWEYRLRGMTNDRRDREIDAAA